MAKDKLKEWRESWEETSRKVQEVMKLGPLGKAPAEEADELQETGEQAGSK